MLSLDFFRFLLRPIPNRLQSLPVFLPNVYTWWSKKRSQLCQRSDSFGFDYSLFTLLYRSKRFVRSLLIHFPIGILLSEGHPICGINTSQISWFEKTSRPKQAELPTEEELWHKAWVRTYEDELFGSHFEWEFFFPFLGGLVWVGLIGWLVSSWTNKLPISGFSYVASSNKNLQ